MPTLISIIPAIVPTPNLSGGAVRLQVEAMRRALRSVHQTGASPLFQVAIALGAVAALTRTRLVWFGSMLVGLIGAGLFLVTIL